MTQHLRRLGVIALAIALLSGVQLLGGSGLLEDAEALGRKSYALLKERMLTARGLRR